ncbi:MAG: glycogen debranching enzyme family protein [Chloroflexi bacterium]|nr:glycogen debranching enzyme family protein [Chloroflexota bacterium]
MIVIPREMCCDPNQALAREWIVTNGLGGFASSTITGANTRRYHGLLVAALKPPLARTVMLSKLDEEVEVDGSTYRLATNEYESGTIHPDGYLYLERVELDGMIPSFIYRAATFSLTKTVWMEHEQNTTYIRYALASDSQPIQLTLLPLSTYRDAHTEVRGSIDWHFEIEAKDGGVAITAFPGAVPFRLLSVPASEYVPLDLWYWRFKHRVEQERGLDYVEDLYLPGLLRRRLMPGEALTVIATTEPPDKIDRDSAAALQRAQARQAALAIGACGEFEKQLMIAADQFIVRRQVEGHSLHTIIAGYPWFGDWGRDTMIALEGLTLATRRYEHARNILLTFAKYVSQGMLPNRFPDISADATTVSVEYNTVDATLWYFHAIDRYLNATGDAVLLEELFPVLVSIVEWHVKGTRYNIHVDPSDGLLGAGEPGVQLTWMDAKVGDWVVTPRIGKPVEINALWYRALRLMEQWAPRVGARPSRYRDLAARVHASFYRYWFDAGGYLYDVIDGPEGNDPSLRPNQLFALSLADDLVPREQARSILQIVERELLTPYGLRTLSPRDANYRAIYRSNQQERDAAYHQGIVWPWLIGAYVDACLMVEGDSRVAQQALAGFEKQLSHAGLGTLGEIHEAQPPFRPVGCFAQAWSVAEVLRTRIGNGLLSRSG